MNSIDSVAFLVHRWTRGANKLGGGSTRVCDPRWMDDPAKSADSKQREGARAGGLRDGNLGGRQNLRGSLLHFAMFKRERPKNAPE